MTKSKQEWQRKFLQTGTNYGCGDLSIMIETVSQIIFDEILEERQRVVEMIEGMKFRETKDSYENGYNSGLSDLQSKLEEK